MKNQKARNKLLPFPVIFAAAQGDVEAMTTVLSHYSSYINKLATRSAKDESGRVYSYIDEELRNRLKIRLIMRTLAFNI